MLKTHIKINKDASEAVKLISEAAGQATKAIADAALSATKLLASQASEAAKITNERDGSDHDLLQRLDTKVDGLKDDIKDLKDGTSAQIANHGNRLDLLDKWKSSLEGENGLLSNIPKNCKRLDALETNRATQAVLISIGIGIMTLLISLLVWHLVGK